MKLLHAARAAGAAFALVILGFAAHAVIGISPTPNGDFGMIHQQWLYNLAGGNNFLYASGITAHAGGGQTLATPLPPAANLIEVDTVASSSDSVLLPYALAGDAFIVRNAGTSAMNIFANPGVNLAAGTTAGGDQINGAANTTAFAISSNQSAMIFSAKNGVWSALRDF